MRMELVKVLTELKAYSLSQSVPALLLDSNGREETDPLQIRNIDGLGPVKATISTTPYSVFDGSTFTGSSVDTRNIVLTIGFNPNWADLTFESLRRLVYAYFMPKAAVNLEFFSDDIPPVGIYGYVESCEPVLFSKDPEIQVSIICPYPHFTAIDPTIITGNAANQYVPVDFTYDGSVETGFTLKVTQGVGPSPTSISIQVEDPTLTYFTLLATVTANSYLSMSSVPGAKYAQNVSLSSGAITSLISKMQAGSQWPTIKPGPNHFAVVTDQGLQTWQLTYYEKYGGL